MIISSFKSFVKNKSMFKKIQMRISQINLKWWNFLFFEEIF